MEEASSGDKSNNKSVDGDGCGAGGSGALIAPAPKSKLPSRRSYFTSDHGIDTVLSSTTSGNIVCRQCEGEVEVLPVCPSSSATARRRVAMDGSSFFLVVVALAVAVASLSLTRFLLRRGRTQRRGRRKAGNNEQVEVDRRRRKADFLKRDSADGSSCYGYTESPAGFIDGWRYRELPRLVSPCCSCSGATKWRLPALSAGFRCGGCCDILDGTGGEGDEDEDEKEVYLDYAGSAVPTKSQLERICRMHQSLNLANPHSTGPAAARTARLVDEAKRRIIEHFNAQPGKRASPFAPSDGRRGNNSRSVDEDNDDGDDDDDHHHHPGYEIVFTSGATQSMQIVAERFFSAPGDEEESAPVLVYPQESHTSVVGMREPVMSRGGSFVSKPLDELLSDIEAGNFAAPVAEKQRHDHNNHSKSNVNQKPLSSHVNSGGENKARHLFVLPLECNFGGRRITDARSVLRKIRQLDHGGRFCALLDVAKAASTGPVDLRHLNPEFACLSFYKLFGEPTGLGCLFVRRDAIRRLLLSGSHYFGGGSVDVVLPTVDFVVSRSVLSSSSNEPSLSSMPSLAGLSNGTTHFRGIISLLAGFDELDRVGGVSSIRRHTVGLAKELVFRLRALVHGNSCPVVELYEAWKGYRPAVSRAGDNYDDNDDTAPGPTISFNIIRSDGSYVGYNEVSKLANLNRPPIQLRTGCFCNPGACQLALELSNEDVIRNYTDSGHVCGDQIDIIEGRPTGAIRASFGKDSTWEDLDSLVIFIERSFVSKKRFKSGKAQGTDRDGGRRQAILSQLYVFPIKSCAPQRIKRWKVAKPDGKFVFDREFALVDSSGVTMRLQMYPKMAFIRPRIDLESSTMTISAPDRPDLVLNLRREEPCEDENGQAVVSVCGNRCGVRLWGDHRVSEWFSDFLKVQCFLARFTERGYELPDNPQMPNPLRSPSVAFANEQPVLLISEHAVQALNDILQDQNQTLVTSLHFRPNMVVRLVGRPLTPEQHHVEDGWKSVKVRASNFGGLQFEVVGQCARCSMVDVDPTSGMRGNTLRALADYRRKNGQINFGIFLRGSSNLIASDNPYNHIDDWVEEGAIVDCQ